MPVYTVLIHTIFLHWHCKGHDIMHNKENVSFNSKRNNLNNKGDNWLYCRCLAIQSIKKNLNTLKFRCF